MSKTKKKKRFFKEHPVCCFCGGTRKAETLDHVPPKACFTKGHWPDEFEFPSCKPCNNGTTKHDTIFGFYTMLLDFNEGNRTEEDRERLWQLRQDVLDRYPEAFPDLSDSRPINRVGSLYTSSPIAISVKRNLAMDESLQVIGEKLVHALYYREMKKILTCDHRFFVSDLQVRDPRCQTVTAYLKELLPDLTIGKRSNMRQYRTRFAYKSGCKPREGFFVFAAQFGYGLILWGLVLGVGMEVEPSAGPLRVMRWKTGGCGLGRTTDSANVTRTDTTSGLE